MDNKQTAIITMMVIGVLVNGYGAVRRGQTVVKDLLGGFVATTLLLALSEGVPVVAEALAGSFLITSLLTSGAPLIAELTSLTTNTPATPAAQSATAQAATTTSAPFTGNTGEHDSTTPQGSPAVPRPSTGIQKAV